MYWIEALTLPFRLSFIHKTPSRIEVKPAPQTLTGANEALANPGNGPQATGLSTIDQLIRNSIINANGDSEEDIRNNIFMARYWYDLRYPERNPYVNTLAHKVSMVLIHLKEEHGYAIAKRTP